MTMQELIERLETGVDRELDWEIHRAAGGLSDQLLAIMESNVEHRKESGVENCYFDSPKYTASVDAALTLFPPNYYYLLGAGITRPDEPMFGAVIYADADGDTILGQGESNSSLPIAICIASLRARLALASDGGSQT